MGRPLSCLTLVYGFPSLKIPILINGSKKFNDLKENSPIKIRNERTGKSHVSVRYQIF